MFQALVSTASRLLGDLNRSLLRGRVPPVEEVEAATVPPAGKYQRLQRVVLTDEVCRTIFEEFAEHRLGARGDEETGWVLLGVRELNEAVVLATLPAGAERNAGVAHVRFNASAQALASRVVRQREKRLSIVGVVHTHPGSLRHPSDGDFQGDSDWVSRLRGRDGVFGIGTADGMPANGTPIARQPKSHVQCLGELCLSWYTLAEGDRQYRPLPVHLTLGPDLARPLHAVWSTIETHAQPLDRLCRQQAGVIIDLAQGTHGPALQVQIALAEPGSRLRLLLDKKEANYFLLQNGNVMEVNPDAQSVDRGVYLVLAELAGKS
jgi:proteasome lid subunit RPN8/RPN11